MLNDIRQEVLGLKPLKLHDFVLIKNNPKEQIPFADNQYLNRPFYKRLANHIHFFKSQPQFKIDEEALNDNLKFQDSSISKGIS